MSDPSFATATAVHRRDETHFEATLRPGWDIGGAINGGHLMAVAARASSEATGRPPLSVTATFLAPAPPGPCDLEVTVARSGRRLANASVDLYVEGSRAMAVRAIHSSPAEAPAPIDVGVPPSLPPFDECPRSATPSFAARPGFSEHVVARCRPGDLGYEDGEPSGRAEVAGWFALDGDEPIDEVALVQACDAFPPVVFNRPEFPFGWAPTLEMTVRVWSRPSPGPLRCRLWSDHIGDGVFDEHGEFWDGSGRLVASSHQLAAVPRSPA